MVIALCQQAESLEHLFLECEKTKQVWKNILDWAGYSRNPGGWTSEKRWLTHETKKKGWRRIILKVATAETLHSLWNSRNRVIFSQQRLEDNIVDIKKYNIVMRCAMHRKLKNHVNVATLT